MVRESLTHMSDKTMTFKSSILKDLDWRGMIFQTTHDDLDDLLASEAVTLYCGFDPTADSLHVGSLLPILMLATFRRHGHNPIGLVGGATGLIGDPSGKSQERNLLTSDVIYHNLVCIGDQLRTILDRALEMHPEALPNPVAPEQIPIVNNADWIGPWSFIDFLRDVGKHFRVGNMLAKDSVKSRLEAREQGLSFTEFSYMLIQGYDFLHLFRERDCRLQVGGSDQWGNITAGTDLIRRVENKPAYGLTFPLIMSSTGQKIGKTEKGATWLAAERTSPYEFYQYWVNRDDADMEQLLKKFTFLSPDEIQDLVGSVERGENRGEVQRKLAYEVTWLVHGKEEADKAVRASQMLFGEAITGLNDRDLTAIFADVPSTTVARAALESGIPVIDLFATTGLVKSKGEGRRLLEQGGVYVNNKRIDSMEHVVTLKSLASETKLVLRAGRKKYHVVSIF